VVEHVAARSPKLCCLKDIDVAQISFNKLRFKKKEKRCEMNNGKEERRKERKKVSNKCKIILNFSGDSTEFLPAI
jgi:hypothetical protein